jgi:NAD(P) transhydrogenase subunit alpha
MSIPPLIRIPREAVPGEQRLGVVPDVVKKYPGLGTQMIMERGADGPAYYRDDAFAAVKLADAAEVFAQADVLLRVRLPAPEHLTVMKPGSAKQAITHV